MKSWLFCLASAVLVSSCTSSYPYLIATENCNCEQYTYRDERGRFEIDVSARYKVDNRVTSTIDLVFRNKSRLVLDLRQGYIKGTSTNIRYPFNDRFQPLPFVEIAPGGRYSMILTGEDVQVSENPWLKIAGEKVILEIRGATLGGKTILPIQLTLVPYNPKLGS